MSEPDERTTESQVNFLLDQVQRLSSLLGHYQKEALGDQFPDQAALDRDVSPLLERRNVLGPLLVEYDKTIEDLKKHNLFYQTELEALAQKIQHLTDENKRLYVELNKALRAQLNNSSAMDDGANSEETISSELVDSLRQQIAVVTEERDSYLDKWQLSQHALLRQQRSSQEQSTELLELNTRHLTTNEELNAVKKDFIDLQNYRESLEMETERSTEFLKRKVQMMESLQSEFDETKSQLGIMKLKNTQLEKMIEQASKRVRGLENEKESYIQSDLESEQERSRMKSHIQERSMLLSEQKKEILTLQEQRGELERFLMLNSRKLSSFESREEEAVRHVRESIDMVEVAMIEKNQALMKAEQASSEVGRLTGTLTELVEEAGVRTKQAVDEVRLECNQSISSMAREIRGLEEELQGKAMELEKALREKQNCQKELDRLKREHISQNLEAVNQLQQRLSSVELDRETAILKMEGIYSDYLQVKEQLEQEQKQSKADRRNNKQRQETLHNQIETQKQEQLRLYRQAEEVKANLKESHLDLEACERKCTQRLQSMSSQFNAKEADLQAKFDGTESSHRVATSELRNLLSSHQRLGAKWREETKTLTEKFENTTRKLKEESSKFRHSSEQLKGELVQSKIEQQTIESKMKSLVSQRDNLQTQVDELGDRNEHYSQQLTRYMTKERQWEQEQKILNNHLTRLQIQSSHSKLKTKSSRVMTAPADKFKPATSDFITSITNIPPPFLSSSSIVQRGLQSPNVLSEPFLHLDTYSNDGSTLSNHTND